MARTPIIAGNWKMNKGTTHEATALIGDLLPMVQDIQDISGVEIVVCVPYTVLHVVRAALEASGNAKVGLGAQDVFWKSSGAYTGQVSAGMLVDAGVRYVIVGHSETRGRFGVPEPDFDATILRHFGESDETVNRKTRAALDAGLIPIVCVGETLAEREAGHTDAVIQTQVGGALEGIVPDQAESLVFAYEPVWAIGTGKTCEADEAERVCGVVREAVTARYGPSVGESIRVQYGGSMKPDNAPDLLERTSIDGGLIGGASLKAGDFTAIVRAAASE